METHRLCFGSSADDSARCAQFFCSDDLSFEEANPDLTKCCVSALIPLHPARKSSCPGVNQEILS